MKKMKKAIAVLLAWGALCAAGCLPTPEEVVIVPKDIDRMVEISRGVAAAPKAGPGAVMAFENNYAFDATAADGRLKIHADAPVRVPASGSLPIVRVKAEGFSQEQATKIFNYFFEGKEPVTVSDKEPVPTKKEILETISYYKRLIAEGRTGDKLMTPEETREEIGRLEKELPKAPETAPDDRPAISDGTMLPAQWNSFGTMETTCELNVELKSGNCSERLLIRRPGEGSKGVEGLLSYFKDYRQHNVDFYNEGTRAEPGEDAAEKVGISMDEAKALCAGFLKAAGVGDAAFSDADLMESSGEYAYMLYYVRTVNGIPAALSMEMGYCENCASLPWSYEYMQFLVTADGIQGVNWPSPTVSGETVNESAKMLPWEKIKEIFEAMIVIMNEPEARLLYVDREINVDVNEIFLAPLRIREANAGERRGMYVPAWVFYGMKYIDGWPETNCPRHIVCAINAVDGGIIDLRNGY